MKAVKLRVLVVSLNYAPEPTGIAPYVEGLCRELRSSGNEVRVITTMPHYPFWRIQEGYNKWSIRENRDGVSVTRFKHYVPSKPTHITRLASELSFGFRAALARWGKPDRLVLLSPALFSTATIMLLRRPSIPSVVWVQDFYARGLQETAGQKSDIAHSLVAGIEGMVLRRATRVVVIHKQLISLVQKFGVPLSRIYAVRNWTHLAPEEHVARDETRAQLGWLDFQTIVVHAGAIGVKQDLLNVVLAAKLALTTQDHHVHFVLFGSGSGRAELEREARGVSSLTILDPIPTARFQAMLNAADILLVNEHPGLREMAVPSKLTSYFASGRPVVAATHGDSLTAAEVRDSEAGLLVAPGDPRALLQAIQLLAKDRETQERLGAAGWRYQQEVLEPAALIQRLIEIVEGSSAASGDQRFSVQQNLLARPLVRRIVASLVTSLRGRRRASGRS